MNTVSKSEFLEFEKACLSGVSPTGQPVHKWQQPILDIARETLLDDVKINEIAKKHDRTFASVWQIKNRAIKKIISFRIEKSAQKVTGKSAFSASEEMIFNRYNKDIKNLLKKKMSSSQIFSALESSGLTGITLKGLQAYINSNFPAAETDNKKRKGAQS
jgi:hypothetical protein